MSPRRLARDRSEHRYVHQPQSGDHPEAHRRRTGGERGLQSHGEAPVPPPPPTTLGAQSVLSGSGQLLLAGWVQLSFGSPSVRLRAHGAGPAPTAPAQLQSCRCVVLHLPRSPVHPQGLCGHTRTPVGTPSPGRWGLPAGRTPRPLLPASPTATEATPRKGRHRARGRGTWLWGGQGCAEHSGSGRVTLCEPVTSTCSVAPRMIISSSC